MNRAEMLENLLFAAGDSMGLPELVKIFECDYDEFEAFVDSEIERREATGGLIIKKFGNRIQLATNPMSAELVFNVFGTKEKTELSRAMIETLSIIAYRQPVTKLEIDEIRGVNSGYTISALIQKGLITEAGRKKTLGMPMLYRTTEAFLRHMDIESLDELPEPNLNEGGEANEA